MATFNIKVKTPGNSGNPGVTLRKFQFDGSDEEDAIANAKQHDNGTTERYKILAEAAFFKGLIWEATAV